MPPNFKKKKWELVFNFELLVLGLTFINNLNSSFLFPTMVFSFTELFKQLMNLISKENYATQLQKKKVMLKQNLCNYKIIIGIYVRLCCS
jgi:hypothetical protein